MPFTFSHPAIVLPFTSLAPRWFSATGLIVGSLSPDFEYFLRMRMQGEFAHTLPGIFFFDLPIGLLLAFAFHNVVRDSLFTNLTTFLRTRLMPFTAFDWNQYFRKKWYVVIPSIVLGAASHIFWDAFTHADGYYVTIISSLNNPVRIGGLQVEVYMILQHSSTLIGGLVVIGAILALPSRDRNSQGHAGMKYWIILASVAFAIITIRVLADTAPPPAVTFVVIAISATLLSLIIKPLIIKILA